MAKGKKSNKSREAARAVSAYEEEASTRPNEKILVFGVLGLIIFGLLAAFILTTNQNVGTDPGQNSAQPAGTAAQTPGDPAAQVKAAQETLNKNPNSPEAMINLGFTLIDVKQYEDAGAYFQKAIAIAPKNVEAAVGLGMTYQFVNRLNEAKTQYDKALEIDPNNDLAKVRKGLFLGDVEKDYEGGLKLIREVEAKQKLGTLKTQLQSRIAEFEQKLAK